ncbi:MAG TPA: ABC transporter permease [Candidatus Pullichristensenella stercorigallinarum]|uniref:Autoinducer 2 import system permease protein LsrD n=1 Tax=Candidatus Pullichristensenella stercorigallinarum TaxID=2840909 RepID=A0A9D1CWC4_9FIRM|nr:ABC transporter permease [Candidatus Pullichristensenella stercorigallinarum]
MKALYRKYRREWSALLALIVTIVLFSILESSYLSVANLTTIITQAVTYGLMGIGMTCVIITGGIDLSVGSALALVACIGAQLAKAGVPIPIWVVVCLAMGFVFGAINGFLVGVLKLQPFVATMGTMSIYRGVSYVITGGFPVLSVPRDYRNVFNFQITSTMTFSVVVFLVFAVIMTIVLKKTKLGAHTYAIGGNEDAARLSGVRVGRTKVIMYGLALLGTTLAGLVQVGRLGTGDPSTGQGYEMDAIAAAAIGGTSMAGGRGNIFGTVIGAILFSALKVGLIVMGVDTFYQYIVTGVVVIFAAYLEIVQGNMMQKGSKNEVRVK